MRYTGVVALALFGFTAASNIAPRPTPPPVKRADDAAVTAITDCHAHGTDLVCLGGTTEFLVKTPLPTATSEYPASFTDCHNHGKDTYCIDAAGEDVEIINTAAKEHEHCHFHAGVEHCVGGDEEEEHGGPGSERCKLKERNYNIPLRVGLLFVILFTSALGVFSPIFLQRALPKQMHVILTVLKQFGTGIILSTAFVHLYTHASLMFTNPCLGELGYEGTTSAIVMAGIFISFVVEYIGHRVVLSKTNAAAKLGPEEQSAAFLHAEIVSIWVMEIGILFHSLLIGLTLVVAGDSFFITLFVVILFHQIFEGIALGTRIAAIGTKEYVHVASEDETDADKSLRTGHSGSEQVSNNEPVPKQVPVRTLSLLKKCGLASLFAFVTPLGMAIGIGVLSKFNGNDRSTILAIGTLDALSAGILVWVGLVEMLAADWMVGVHGQKAELANADLFTVGLAGFGLLSGMVAMSVLGKWA